jgi:hypothetical protein
MITAHPIFLVINPIHGHARATVPAVTSSLPVLSVSAGADPDPVDCGPYRFVIDFVHLNLSALP